MDTKKKKKTTSYTCVYKRPTSDLGTHTGRKWGLKKIMIFFLILISDKIGFKIKTVMRDKEKLHNDQEINSRRKYKNCKYICTQHQASLMTQPVKNLPAIQEIQKTWVQSLDWEDLPEVEMATYSSIVAWEIPRTEEPGGLQSIESQRVGLSSVMSDSLRPYGPTVFFQAPLSMGFSRQQYQKVPFRPPGDLPDPGIEPAPPASAGALSLSHQGSSWNTSAHKANANSYKRGNEQ